jgi:predicted phage-related endonuclease
VNTRSTVPKPEDRDEWLAVRRPYFNASYAAALFDEHPYVTAGDVATIKLTGKEQAQTRAMDRGRRLEDVIAKWWADEQGCEVYEPNKLYIAGRVMATVDRLVDDGGAEPLMPVEIKTANIIAPEPLPYWVIQCQAIMLCTGARALALVWFDSTMDLRSRMLAADEITQEAIADGAERFMAAIDLGMVPDWVGLSYANQLDLHPEARVPPVALDDAGFNAVMALRFVKSQRLAAEREEERIKAEIAGLLGEAEAGTFGGKEIVRWSNVKGRRDLDAKRLAAEHPDVAASYWVERAGTRRMTVVGNEEEAA